MPTNQNTSAWPYARNFDFRDGLHDGHLFVAIKTLGPMRDDRDIALHQVKGWIRMTVWGGSNIRDHHVNVDSDLRKLLRACVQDFSDGLCVFLVNYDTGMFAPILREDAAQEEANKGLWPREVAVPRDIQAIIDQGYPEKPTEGWAYTLTKRTA